MSIFQSLRSYVNLNVNKNVIADVAVLGNVKHTLRDILKLLKKNNHKDWIAKFGEFYEIEFDKVIDREYNKKTPYT